MIPPKLRAAPLAGSTLLAICLIGLCQVLLGAALLITPHWFTAAAYAPWNGYEVPIGLTFLGGGAALLWIAILPVRRPWVLIVAHLLVTFNFVGIAAIFWRAGALHSAVVNGVLALGALVLGGAHLGLTTGSLARFATPRPLATLAYLVAAITGALMLLRPGQYGGPLYAPMQGWLPIFGIPFTLLGSALLARDVLAPHQARRAASIANLALAGMLIWWGSAFLPTKTWTGVLNYALLALGVLDAAYGDLFPGRRKVTGVFADPLWRRGALAVASALVATALVMTLALTANSANRAQQEAASTAEILASAVATQLEFYLQTHLAVVGQLSELPSVKAAELDRIGVALRESKAAFPGFANLSFIDPTGQQIVRSTEGEFVNVGSKPYIQRVLAGEGLLFGGVTTSVATGEPIVVMAAPVRDVATNSVIGAVSASIQLPSISTFLTGLPATRDREVLVFDTDGLAVTRPGADLLATRGEFSEMPTPALEAAQQGKAGSTHYEIDGQHVLAGYAYVPYFDWNVIVQQPEAVALADAWEVEERAYLVLLVASILLAGLGGLLVSRLFRPVAALIEPLQALGEGHYNVALPVAPEGQVGDLVRAIERMRLDLQDRERELATSEAQFRSLIENGSDVVIVLDHEGLVRMVTPTVERALGYVVDEFVDGQYLLLVHPDDVANARELFADVSARPDGERRSEWRLRHRDDDWRSFEIVMQNRMDDPSVQGIVLSLRDVTEQRQLQALQDRLYAELEAEVRRAAEIQAQLLPHAAPDLPGYEFAGVCVPARQVGGDFFDWLAGHGAVRLSLGDVMGKGMPASILTATVRAALRVVEKLPVSAAVEAVNRALSPDLAHSDSFITLFHAALEPESGQLTYVDAGHGMAFIQRHDGTVEPLRQRALPLGVLADALYPAGITTLEPGETLVIYSDGLPDARPELRLDAEGVAGQLGELKHAQAKLEQLVSLVDNIETRPDDLTLVILRRRETAVRLEERLELAAGGISG